MVVTSGVSVNAPAIHWLVDHLSQNGLPQDTGAIQNKLITFVNDQWKKNQAAEFNDSHGRGWIFDLSSKFDGLMVYAIARPADVTGLPIVTTVVESQAVENFYTNNESFPPAPSIERLASEVMSRTAPPAPPPSATSVPIVVAKPSLPTEPTPMLVVVTNQSAADDPSLDVIRCTTETVGNEVQLLILRGVRSEDIEIWSSVKKPKLVINFE